VLINALTALILTALHYLLNLICT